MILSVARSRPHLLVRSAAPVTARGGNFVPSPQRSLRGFVSARREPPLPPLSNPVENAIEAARKRGDFANLGGSDKPLPKGDAMQAAANSAGRMSPSDLLSRKAEYEMGRAVHNKELEHLDGKGEKLKYKGTGIVSPKIGGDGGSCGGGDSMSTYILDQAQLSSEDMKKQLKK